MGDAKVTEESVRSSFPKAKEIFFASEANELFFGVVGHVGSGTGFVSKKLVELVKARGYQAEIIKASKAIRVWANRNDDVDNPLDGVSVEKTEAMQNLGDLMRGGTDPDQSDYAAVSQGVVSLIRRQRATWNGPGEVVEGEAVPPDPESQRAYIIESIRHPAEVDLFRLVYGDAFALIGVVCHEDVREERLLKKYFKREKESIHNLMERDADDKGSKHGQHVADAFWESDYFIDNTADEEVGRDFSVNEELGRLIDIITHSKIVRPRIAETGMHVAVSAQIRSSCLSRQVGAAIVDQEGNVLAVGSNEVPKAGGGVYGEEFDSEESEDWRCHACHSPHCSSNDEQNKLIEKLIEAFPEINPNENFTDDELLKKIRKVGLGSILEFTRAIHAEMDALTSVARKGISVKGSWMFVTTFPCHYCARHIVAAGIDQVQYIEPYPKSRALSLHGDSITDDVSGWTAPSSQTDARQDGNDADYNPAFRTAGDVMFGKNTNRHKVLFRPFSGVAPRLYHKAFAKDRSLKDEVSGKLRIGQPEWGGKWGIRLIPYTDLEARLTQEEEE